MKTLGRSCLFLILMLFSASLSSGQTSSAHDTPFGVRAGYTNWRSYSQPHVGGHAYIGELWPNIEFTPNFELGFGDNVFIMTLNGDLTYLFSDFVRHPWGLYGGGSLSFNLVNPKIEKTRTDIGFSVLLGTRYTFSNDHIGMFELRAGVIDSPHIKATFGYTLF